MLLAAAVALGLSAQLWLIPRRPVWAWVHYGVALGLGGVCLGLVRPKFASQPDQEQVSAWLELRRWALAAVCLLILVVLHAPGKIWPEIKPPHLFWAVYLLLLIICLAAVELLESLAYLRWGVIALIVLTIAGLQASSWPDYRINIELRPWGLQAYLITLLLTVAVGLLLEFGGRTAKSSGIKRWEWAGLGLILLAALGMRLYHLTEIPPEIYDDETWHGWHEAGIMASRNLFHEQLFRGAHEGVPLMTFINMSPFIRIFGNNLWAWRFSGVFYGLAGIVVVFLVVRCWYPALIALTCAGLIATWGPHLHHSRIGTSCFVQTLLLTTLCVWCWSRAVLGYGWSNWIWCGLGLGFALQNYAADRLIPFLLAGLSGIYVCFHWHRRQALGLALGLAAIGGSAVVSLGPYVPYALYSNDQLNHRLSITIFGDSQPAQALRESFHDQWLPLIWHQFLHNFGMFHVYPEDPGEPPLLFGRLGPHLEPLTAALAALGLIAMLGVEWKQARTWVFLGWAVATLVVGGMLTTQSPEIKRVFPAGAAYLLWPALGISWLSQTFKSLWKPLGIVSAVGLVLAAGACNVNEYLLDYYHHYYEPHREKLLWQAILSQDPQSRLIVTDEEVRYKERLFPKYVFATPTAAGLPEDVTRENITLIFNPEKRPAWVMRWEQYLADVQSCPFPQPDRPRWTLVTGHADGRMPEKEH